MLTLGFLAVVVAFGLGLVLLVIAVVVALIDNKVNYGQWRPRRTPKQALGSEPPASPERDG
jgi:hypothetical protein